MITSNTKICGVIGDPVFGSMSPVIHNAGLKAKGLDNDFVSVAFNVSSDKLANFIEYFKSSNIRGLSVTLPHKENVMRLLDEIDPVAQEIGAVNTIVNYDGKTVGYNADWVGASEPLTKITDLQGKKVAVIGAGGAAKAFVYGLIKNGADVIIYNRTVSKAKELAEQFDCEYSGFEHIEQIKNAEIICNASTIGFSGTNQQDQSPIPKGLIDKNHIIFDAIYSPLKTKLLQEAEEAGATTISGTEMLLHQGFAQFKKFYEQEAPKAAMRTALEEYLDAK